ncbi:hypothetical protein [Streptomyces sp. NPDC005301]|uniref:hypothetical protein n=1 Tax=Streptomyces sp. NPDC005301 TaxID=3156874 RepID=UPI0033B2851A
MTDTAQATASPDTARTAPPPGAKEAQDRLVSWTRPVRGRHRRPRPRRTLVAVGGLALAAGALSLVRLTPDPLGGGGERTEAGPHGSGAASGPADNAAATVEPVPTAGSATPSATGVMGGAGATPTSGATVVPTSPTSPTGTPMQSRPVDPAAGRTGIPEAPADPVTSAPPAPSRPPTTSAAPRPAPSHSTRAPDPGPDDPGLCVPVIGLCVDPLARVPRPGG